MFRARSRSRGQGGFAILLVLTMFLVIALIGAGLLSVVMSDLHGAAANQLAMQAVNVAEAGLHHAIAKLDADPNYRGPDEGAIGLGTFRVTVECVEPASEPADDCFAVHLKSLGQVGRARRLIEARMRRPGSGDIGFGICAREGVELDQGTILTSDVASNGDILLEGPPWAPGAIKKRPAPPPDGTSVRYVLRPGPLNGTYSWRVTFVDALGAESLGSVPIVSRPLVSAYVVLANIPRGDSSIVMRRIYRTMQGDDTLKGPWVFVDQINNNTTTQFDDDRPDVALKYPIPTRPIYGNALAGAVVDCGQDPDCGNGAQAGHPRRVEGEVRSHVRRIPCREIPPPPCEIGAGQAPLEIPATPQVQRYSSLSTLAEQTVLINTPSRGDLHIHVGSVILARDSRVRIKGSGRVFLYVNGRYHLGQRTFFGVDNFDRLIRPADRIQIVNCARDESRERASVVWDRGSRVSAVIFAPYSNVEIDGAREFNGSLYANFIRINQSTGLALDLGAHGYSMGTKGRFRYIESWYDEPRPTP